MKLIEDLGTQYASKKSKRKHRYGIYECPVCLEHFRAETSSVKKGFSKGCKECQGFRYSSHRECKTKLYYVWADMKTRCYNSKSKRYRWYGAKGVTVCKEWHEFIPFRDWAKANGYVEGLTIDKDELCEILNISPKIYSPETCQWITQSKNTKLIFS